MFGGGEFDDGAGGGAGANPLFGGGAGDESPTHPGALRTARDVSAGCGCLWCCLPARACRVAGVWPPGGSQVERGSACSSYGPAGGGAAHPPCKQHSLASLLLTQCPAPPPAFNPSLLQVNAENPMFDGGDFEGEEGNAANPLFGGTGAWRLCAPTSAATGVC
jgi:hypothetical protein